jgi:hypothetical protein
MFRKASEVLRDDVFMPLFAGERFVFDSLWLIG